MAVLDIANTFLQAENDKTVNMLLRRMLAEMMISIDPTVYRECVPYSANRVPMLYMRLSSALYGILRAALLFYKRLRIRSRTWGFRLTRTTPTLPT